MLASNDLHHLGHPNIKSLLQHARRRHRLAGLSCLISWFAVFSCKVARWYDHPNTAPGSYSPLLASMVERRSLSNLRRLPCRARGNTSSIVLEVAYDGGSSRAGVSTGALGLPGLENVSAPRASGQCPDTARRHSAEASLLRTARTVGKTPANKASDRI